MTRYFAILCFMLVGLASGLAEAQHVDYSQLRCFTERLTPAFDRHGMLEHSFCYNPDGSLRGEHFRLTAPGNGYQAIMASGQTASVFENKYGGVACRRDVGDLLWVECFDQRGQPVGRVQVEIPAARLQ